MRTPFKKRVILLRTADQRYVARELLAAAPLDEARPIRITFDDPLPLKSRETEQKYHAMIGDIARQYEHCGKRWEDEDMKRILVDQFRRDTIRDSDVAPLWADMGVVDMAPSFDGSGVVALGVQTRKFPARLAAVFVEWLYALGAELQIVWTEPKGKP